MKVATAVPVQRAPCVATAGTAAVRWRARSSRSDESAVAARTAADGLANHFDIADRPNFDTTRARPRKLGRDTYGLLHALGLDHVEPGDHFLRLRERPVERRRTPIAN